MIRITATGNNFGAGDIIFTAFGDSNLLILNAEVTFDPSNPAYRAVSELEIYVPDLPFERSAVSGMLMFGTLDGKKNGTAIKSRIKDRNTIAVEKVTAWDDNDTVTLVFSNSYIPRNIRGPVTRLKWNIADVTDITGGTVSTGQTYWTATDEWVFLGIALSMLEQADAGTQVSFKIRGLPEMEDFDGILMDSQSMSPSVGTAMLRFHIRDNVFTVEPIHPDRSWHYMQHCGFICYVPRKRVADE